MIQKIYPVHFFSSINEKNTAQMKLATQRERERKERVAHCSMILPLQCQDKLSEHILCALQGHQEPLLKERISMTNDNLEETKD